MTLSRRILNLFGLIFNVIFLAACGFGNPTPIALASVTPNNRVPTSFPPTTTSTAAPTVPPVGSTTPTTSPLLDKIRLYHNQIATRTTQDQYSFSVVVLDKKADFVPKSIQIIERGTSIVLGPYQLRSENEAESLCSKILKNPDFKFYETALIDYTDFPQGFIVRAYKGDFIFRVTIEHLSGAEEVVEVPPQDICYSAVQ